MHSHPPIYKQKKEARETQVHVLTCHFGSQLSTETYNKGQSVKDENQFLHTSSHINIDSRKITLKAANEKCYATC